MQKELIEFIDGYIQYVSNPENQMNIIDVEDLAMLDGRIKTKREELLIEYAKIVIKCSVVRFAIEDRGQELRLHTIYQQLKEQGNEK